MGDEMTMVTSRPATVGFRVLAFRVKVASSPSFACAHVRMSRRGGSPSFFPGEVEREHEEEGGAQEGRGVRMKD